MIADLTEHEMITHPQATCEWRECIGISARFVANEYNILDAESSSMVKGWQRQLKHNGCCNTCDENTQTV